jgi:superfamily I DNA/RNA helicase
MLTLPTFDDLTPDQDDVLALPLDASAVIVGPPGTGKTAMAVQRAHLLDRARRPTLLLMYGRLLSSYTAAAVDQLGINSVVSTYHSWFSSMWRRAYGSPPPRSGEWTYDWGACKTIILSRPIPAIETRHIIVDEGQDFPPDFYLVLSLISRSLTVFADDNQRLTADQSTIAEIQAATTIQTLLRLGGNRRSPRPIAELANFFYNGAADEIPALPVPADTDEMPFLAANRDIGDAVNMITEYERGHPTATVGILLARADDVRTFHCRMAGRTRMQAQLYLGGFRARPNDPTIDLSRPGIKILTLSSCKGLEFDAVFIPELQTLQGDPADPDVRMKMYVASTRARRTLGLLYSGAGEPAIVRTLPRSLLTIWTAGSILQ